MAEVLVRRSLLALGERIATLAPAQRCPLADVAVYDNVAEFHPEFGAHYRADIYTDRVATLNAVDLVRLGRATVHAGGDHLVTVGGAAVEEQVPPWWTPDTPSPAPAATTHEVAEDTVVVARFGVGTWGHWLGDLLPKVVMTEAAFPGRFRYAVPVELVGRGGDESPWRTFQQSLVAYGIAPSRLVPLPADRDCVLSRAWAVTPVWSDHVMHPAAVQLMRARVARTSGPPGAAAVALVRRSHAKRTLDNEREVFGLLGERGFAARDIAGLSFLEQVAVFREARTVFSVLGSGLSGLLFSPDGVGVVSVAPSFFGDRFFYALIVARSGRYADVRGPVREADPDVPHRSSFTVDLARLECALESLVAVPGRRAATTSGPARSS